MDSEERIKMWRPSTYHVMIHKWETIWGSFNCHYLGEEIGFERENLGLKMKKNYKI